MTSAEKPIANAVFSEGDSLYCLRCKRRVPNHSSGRCGNCGMTYDLANPATYRAAPMFLRWKFWFPGFVMAVVSGVLSYAVILKYGEMGGALFFAVPVSFGAILGYATRASIWFAIALVPTAILAVGAAIFGLDLAGLYCGATLMAILCGPALVGVSLGWLLRLCLKQTSWNQRVYLPLLPLALIPYLSMGVESFWPPGHEIATITTELTFHSTPREAWESIQFYEQVEHQPPLMHRLLLPKPVRTEGSKQAVGDITRCIYRRGHLVKRISRVEPERELAFDVVEQTLHFEHDVRLIDGSFRLEPLDGQRTRVILSTRYERWLRPAWLWRPMEEDVVHQVHGHVLEGMKRKAEQLHESRPPQAPYPPAPPPVLKPPAAAILPPRTGKDDVATLARAWE